MKFSRGDILSASLTLIVTGITYWVGGRNAAFIALGVGVILMLAAHFMYGAKPAPPLSALPASAPTQSRLSSDVSRSGNANLENVGNPKIEIHNYPPPPKQPLPASRPPEPKSNISFKNVRPAWIWYDEHEGAFVEVADPKDAVRGVIARFKNESGVQEAADAEYIRAELVFRDVNEQELEQSVHSACWIHERTDTADFKVGEDQRVFLGAVWPEDNKEWMVPWKEQKQTWQGQYYDLAGHRFPGMRSIEIRLIGASNKWLVPPVVVDVVINDGEPTVAVRPPVQP